MRWRMSHACSVSISAIPRTFVAPTRSQETSVFVGSFTEAFFHSRIELAHSPPPPARLLRWSVSSVNERRAPSSLGMGPGKVEHAEWTTAFRQDRQTRYRSPNHPRIRALEDINEAEINNIRGCPNITPAPPHSLIQCQLTTETVLGKIE